MFHGDIKPDNIFYENYGHYFELTTDIGSLLYLGEQNENSLYIGTCYSEKYASP